MRFSMLTDNRFRLTLGCGLITFGVLNGVLYYYELAVAAQSKADIQELNQTRMASAVATTVPSPAPSETVLISESIPPPPSSGKIKISTATEADFDSLPGIGPAKAKAIIAYRTATPFKSVDDLQKVKGIGEKTFQDIKPLIEL